MRIDLDLEDIETGDVYTSAGRTITGADLVGFAGLNGDFNPIHMDVTVAEYSPFGQRVVHGILGVAVATGLLGGLDVMVNNAGIQRGQGLERAVASHGWPARPRRTIEERR
ncbi:hypothetical protein ER308_10535 [Egibacter rhizosphaerae]|uniref:MaoC-like domain-containing protein n=1 Tax=Egibacter rhizosphaerae TaxID=1670831 RepID=A0A411YFA8_9ACTN|nr:MaoC/PaaZ C-terminal domain-containing protein [Egibacter rhizosphaerae]QBI19954.1 hypothetical protein ER308_10535 [Egibacter rhizosphaerae]